MFWLSLTVLALLGGALTVVRRRRYESVAEEPWRASLRDEDDFDADELRRAEEALAADDGDDDDAAEEPWYG